jgi:hypothetical protein
MRRGASGPPISGSGLGRDMPQNLSTVSVAVSLLRSAVGAVLTFLGPSWDGPIRRYRPEDHYMRGPGPKWREKHFLDRTPPAARSPHKNPRASPLQLLAAPRGKSPPQAAVASERLADRRHLRLAGLNGCREDAPEPIIVNPREVLTQERGGKFIRP